MMPASRSLRGWMASTTATLVLAAAAAAGCGGGGTATGAGAPGPGAGPELGDGVRLELVTMSDHAFTPNRFEARVGERVTYRILNVGTVRHEAVLGDGARQDDHARAMREWTATSVPGGAGRSRAPRTARSVAAHPGMNDPFAVLVEPGSSGEITISFDRPGTLILGCHEPGHWEAGMRADITVRA